MILFILSLMNDGLIRLFMRMGIIVEGGQIEEGHNGGVNVMRRLFVKLSNDGLHGTIIDETLHWIAVVL